MLRRNNDSINTLRQTVNVFYGYLSLSIRTKIRELAVLSDLGKTLRKLMRQGNRKRHKLRSLVTRVTEHQALVTCAGIKTVTHFAILCFKALINTKSNISTLLVNGTDYSTSRSIKAVFCSVITDFCNGITYNLLYVYTSLGGNLTHNGDDTGGCKGLTRNTALGVLCDYFIEYRIGNFIAYFVGMTFGHGF